MKSGLKRTLALAVGLCTLSLPVSAATTAFSDVPSTYWGYSYITEAASKGLVSGIGNGKYGPEDTLSNSQFITMVCNMFYSDLVKAQGSSSDWWRPYMNAAYSAGLLQGTTAGQLYASNGGWTADAANGAISRYDMAQIIYNLSEDQGWEAPDSVSLVLSQLLIQDYSSIPTNYQMAVAVCYAKGFLSGDNTGKFNGTAISTRAQAAVVLCNLDEAKSEMTAPTYTNTTRLTNGLAVTEVNVADLLDDLWASYPDYDVWNMDLTYTSQRLGSGTGDKAFVYMLSDKVFGAMPVQEIDDPADLRVGDVISLDDGSEYGLVYEVTDRDFTYVSCDSDGWIFWKNDMELDDLGRDDTVYTRYLTLPEADDVLSNGDEATDRNVERLLEDLQEDRDYREGRSWDLSDEYESDVLGTAEGTRGFAYCISDEIFGDLDYQRIDANEYEDDDLRVGDVIYDRYGHGLYGVVVEVRSGSYTYVSVDEDDEEIYWGFIGYYEDLDLVYTRYPEDSDRDSQQEDELANGEEATVGNVTRALEDLQEDRDFEDGDWWDLNKKYDSEVFGEYAGHQGFAYRVSDEIFGALDYTELDADYPEEMRVGDVIRDGSLYGVVVTVDYDDETYTYVALDVDEEDDGEAPVEWDFFGRFRDVERLYTRYPDSDSRQDDDELTNGEKINPDNVSDLLEEVLDSRYGSYYNDREWDMDYWYDDSEVFPEADGREGFAYFISDKIFGDLVCDDVRDPEDLEIGDVIEVNGDYGIVEKVESNKCRYYTLDKNGNVYIDTTYFDDDDIDDMFTRYP